MKNALYVIAGLLVALWAIIFWGYSTFKHIDFILAIALFIVLIRILFGKHLKYMKESLFVISGLLMFIWVIVFFGLGSFGIVHILAVLAGFILLVRLVFSKQLPK